MRNSGGAALRSRPPSPASRPTGFLLFPTFSIAIGFCFFPLFSILSYIFLFFFLSIFCSWFSLLFIILVLIICSSFSFFFLFSFLSTCHFPPESRNRFHRIVLDLATRYRERGAFVPPVPLSQTCFSAIARQFLSIYYISVEKSFQN